MDGAKHTADTVEALGWVFW